jgi:hypothetical protein
LTFYVPASACYPALYGSILNSSVAIRVAIFEGWGNALRPSNYLGRDNRCGDVPPPWRLQELPYTDVGRADDGPSSEHTAATNAINSAMQRALWDSYRISQFDFSGDTDWGELEVRMHGTPTFYFDRRDCQAFAELKCARKVAA